MEERSILDSTQGPGEEDRIGYAVDRFGSATFADVLASLMRNVDLDGLSEAIDEFGLEMVAEQFLRALIEGGKLYGEAEAAYTAEARILDEDRHTSPTVHPVTVADLADEFTRLGLTTGAASCG